MDNKNELNNRVAKIKECLDKHNLTETRYEHHLEETVVEYDCATCHKHFTLYYKLDKITL